MLLGGEIWEKFQGSQHQRAVCRITVNLYLLTVTLQYHLNTVPENFKPTAVTLKTALYSDSYEMSLNLKQKSKLFLKSKLVMLSSHFNLRCWMSICRNASKAIQWTQKVFDVCIPVCLRIT